MPEVVITRNPVEIAAHLDRYKSEAIGVITDRMSAVWQHLSSYKPWNATLMVARAAQAYAYVLDPLPDPDRYELIFNSMPDYGSTPTEVAEGFVENMQAHLAAVNGTSIEFDRKVNDISAASEVSHVDTLVAQFISGTGWLLGA